MSLFSIVQKEEAQGSSEVPFRKILLNMFKMLWKEENIFTFYWCFGSWTQEDYICDTNNTENENLYTELIFKDVQMIS